MRSIVENAMLARVAGVLGVLGHLVAAIFYLLLPGLVVPFPALYAFWGAWAIILAASLWWLRGQPWRSLVVPLVGLPAAIGTRLLGERLLGWAG